MQTLVCVLFLRSQNEKRREEAAILLSKAEYVGPLPTLVGEQPPVTLNRGY